MGAKQFAVIITLGIIACFVLGCPKLDKINVPSDNNDSSANNAPSNNNIPHDNVDVQEIYVHKYLGMEFPEAVGSFQRASITNYSGPHENNIGVGYQYDSEYTPITVTVYVYPVPDVESINPDSEGSQAVYETLFLDHYNRVISAIATQHEDVILDKNEDFILKQPSLSLKGKRAVVNMKTTISGQRNDMVSEVYLFRHGKWFVKYRVSYPWAVQNQVQKPFSDFLYSLRIPEESQENK